MDEKQREKIRREARQILDKFAKSLEKVPAVKVKEVKSESWREEKEGKTGDSDFRKRMFSNAPNKDEDFLIAEKKEW